MKAIMYTSYGSPDVLQMKEVEKPVPADDEVLVKTAAASVNSYDLHFLQASPFFIRFSSGMIKPKNPRLGADFAGRVEAVGKNISRHKIGDEVYGLKHGAFAEYICAAEAAFALKPANLTFEQGAAVPMAALTALQGLRDQGHIEAGQTVLINGASGGVGTFAVQIASCFGAEVTAVCSTGNVEKAQSLGAKHVIDYTREDFTMNGQHYDLILAANGYHSMDGYRRALSPNGTYVMSGGSMRQVFQAMLLRSPLSRNSSQKIRTFIARANQEDLDFLKELLEAGKIKPVIDRRYTFSETAEALRYVAEGHAKGKVVITME
ncbi:MAG: NAD(P)-dependent alcohol dehydrogenase [Anaerolineaceae bacterium]|nr:NAD(P)-dependent alcohol dehydrogenase [Anaerolineaceae bacterium]